MAKIDLNNMEGVYFDVLREIGNIGAGNATTALATMIGTKVDMRVPKVGLMEFKEIGAEMGGEETIMAGIYQQIRGDISGSIMFLLEEKSARVLVSKLMGVESNSSEPFNEMEISALQEIGNIITGSYLSSLSTLTNMTIDASVPSLCIDMCEAILSVPAIEFAELGDKMLLIKTEFSDDVKLEGYFILVPDLTSYEKILTSLGM
ncbi:MAG: chemotaxis protein CheC [Lachnospiraceae bacterium]|jgi:chemotaxis protein CheC|nr:chemotaxis protein CheC [Lachnospiraceae bacterium]MCI6409085.1 chemotaxis protein CheC [Lachnospiraceae bacterium]MCI6665296.1 chemotaxis protein CheC [Lachnospiraceae bacterium]MCI6978156.1 chemotaxis protein CheC [Lachnospiraceae bacterium]MDD6580409.1 chemotaxis protein CheC [Lachnospiraceae bacterium]